MVCFSWESLLYGKLLPLSRATAATAVNREMGFEFECTCFSFGPLLGEVLNASFLHSFDDEASRFWETSYSKRGL